MRLQLNNKDLFQFGPLDQGWWPDGLYTAPTDEALCCLLYTSTERQGNETVKAPYSIEAGKEIHYKISDYRSFFITFAFGLGATPLQMCIRDSHKSQQIHH